MNYDNNSNRPEGGEGNFSVAGPDDVLAELDALPDCCEEESDQDGYSRIVSIDFPIEVGHLYGVSSISVSVRDLLTWFAAGHPDESKLALNIRDDFYAGNSEEDHCYYVDPSRYMPPTFEEMAVLRVALDKGRRGRALKREALEADAEANRAAETAIWLPFQAEREALQAEQQVLFQRRALLEGKWEGFVVEREAWGNDRPAREAEKRAELELEEEALLADDIAWHERRSQLYARISEMRSRKEA
jgi:hypothetical protein